jgi:hypothetical protein
MTQRLFSHWGTFPIHDTEQFIDVRKMRVLIAFIILYGVLLRVELVLDERASGAQVLLRSLAGIPALPQILCLQRESCRTELIEHLNDLATAAINIPVS